MTTKPPEGQLYRTAEGDERPSGPVDLGTTIPQELSYNQAYHPRNGAERNSDQTAGAALAAAPPVGAAVVHRTSGQHGTVTGHRRHGYAPQAVPEVAWAGEDASWPQGVSANALRVEGSTPVDLYAINQGAADHRPVGSGSGPV